MKKFLKNQFPIVACICLISSSMQSQIQKAGSVETPYTCEDNEARLDQVAVAASKTTLNGSIIVISRLGQYEKSGELHGRRLHNAREYLLYREKGISRSQIIVAQGERTSGLGRVEIYLQGRLVEKLLVGKNENLCVDCCENHNIPKYRKLPF